MPDIVTVTLNPAIDISTSVERISPAHKLRCASERRDAGGGGINVARVIRRLGGDVLAAYPAGGPIGALLERLVSAEDVSSCVAPISGDTRESFTVCETGTGREFRFVLPGPQLSEDEVKACITAVEAELTGAHFLVASGSLPRGAPNTVYASLAGSAKKKGVRFVIDAAGTSLRSALREGVFLVKPNLRELEELTGDALRDRASRVAACRQLIASGGAEIVALTMGEEGAMLVTQGEAWASHALDVDAKSSVGAGDSFLGALLFGMSCGQSPSDTLRWGVAAGAAALLTPGTELCRREDVEALFPRVVVERL